jgi:hypothetical protein
LVHQDVEVFVFNDYDALTSFCGKYACLNGHPQRSGQLQLNIANAATYPDGLTQPL